MKYEDMMQNPEEFLWLLKHIAGARSILEIGSYDGASLWGMAKVAAPGAVLRSIDDNQHGTEIKLESVIYDLHAAGFDAAFHIGNSHQPEALEWAKTWAPYDFIFIDGDHDDPGVFQDWEDYGPLGKRVGFHDINAEQHSVVKLWARIKAQGFATDEMIVNYATPVYGWMGIGIVEVRL